MSDPACCQHTEGCTSCAPVTKPKKKFVGKRKTKTETTVTDGIKKFKAIQIGSQIPDEILNNEELKREVQTLLPRNYNFEIYKTLSRIHQLRAHRVALQLPEGLLMYATTIADVLTVWSRRIAQQLREEETNALQWQGVEDVIIMGDVTYGACCIDDYSCQALDCALLVHYGHSCLVPTTHTTLPVLYVFVDILIDLEHFIQTVRLNFNAETRLLLISTIQFSQALHHAHQQLKQHYPHLHVPQAKPLSGGEILGCTSPAVASSDYDALIYLGDGRFHLESIMIANPTLTAYRYDPYSKQFTIEKYDFQLMKKIRRSAIDQARRAKKVGLILGTLGRQGSPSVLTKLEESLKHRNIEYIVLLLSEIFPSKLALFADVDAWIQVACPRLSIDWGYAFNTPLLSPYEAEVAFNDAEWSDSTYPMDYYANSGGAWSVYTATKLHPFTSASK